MPVPRLIKSLIKSLIIIPHNIPIYNHLSVTGLSKLHCSPLMQRRCYHIPLLKTVEPLVKVLVMVMMTLQHTPCLKLFWLQEVYS